MLSLTRLKKRLPKISSPVGVLLAVSILMLMLGGYYLMGWLSPGQRITPRTVQRLAEVPVLIRHDDGITAIAFNPQRHAKAPLITSSFDGVIKVWHLDGNEAQELLAMQANRRFALSANGKQLATLNASEAVELWQLDAIDQMFQRIQADQSVNAIAFSPDSQILASGNADGTIKLRDWRSGKLLQTFKAYESRVIAIAFHPKGEILASSDGVEQATIKLWNWRTRKLVGTLKGDEFGSTLSFSADGQTLISQNYDETTTLWDWDNNQVMQTLQGKNLIFSPDGQTIASASDDGIKLSNRNDATNALTIAEGKGPIAFSPDGKTLASDSTSGMIKLWNRSDGRLIRTFNRRETGRTIIKFSADGQTLVSVSDNGRVTLGRVADGSERLSFPVKEGTAASISPNGQMLAISSDDKTIRLLPLNAPPRLVRPLKITLKDSRAIAFGPDDQTLILSAPNQIKQFRLKNQQEVSNIKIDPDTTVLALARSPNGQMLAWGGIGRMIQLWDLQHKKLLRSLPLDVDQAILSLAFHPNGQQLASSNPVTGVMQLWNVNNGQLLRSWNLDWAGRVAFSPDGQLLANAAMDKIQLWNPQTGQKLRTLKGHGAGVSAIAFSPDGKTLATGSWDQTIKLWRVK